MEYRQLSLGEIAALADEIENLSDYMAARDYAKKYYGPAAKKIDVTTEGEYNDEGGTNWYITSVTVNDAQGKELFMLEDRESVERILTEYYTQRFHEYSWMAEERPNYVKDNVDDYMAEYDAFVEEQAKLPEDHWKKEMSVWENDVFSDFVRELWAGLPEEEYGYTYDDLDTPPNLTYPVVYVPVEEAA